MRRGVVVGSVVAAALVATAGLAALVAPAAPVGRGVAGADLAGTGSRQGTPVVDPRARALMARAAAAPATTAYTGTQYATAWSGRGTSAQILQVSHDPATGTTWRPLGGRATEAPRMHAAGAHAPSLLAVGTVDLLARHYSLAPEGAATVAGRPVDVVVARRPGSPASDAVVARFWLDQVTGLVLRREVYRRDGRPGRATAFVEVSVSPATPRTRAAGAWPEALDADAVEHLRRLGWMCPTSLPGPLDLVDARRDPRSGVLHLSYADGIDSLSLFQQRGRLDEDRLRGYRRDAVAGHRVWTHRELPGRVVWSEDGMVYTVVADTAQRTVERAVAALYRASDTDGGRWDRLGRGLDRVASWFNPLD